jgi:hypothetical protein
MKFEDLPVKDVRMLSFHDNKITVVLSKDRIETFTFKNRTELEEALRIWATIPDDKKPPLRNSDC